MSSRTAVTGKVGEFSFESDVQTEESSSRNLITRRTFGNESFVRTSPDGRYLFYISNSYSSSVEVIDTILKKKKTLNFNFSAATINGKPLTGSFEVKDYWAFDLEHSLVFFVEPLFGCYVAIGVVNLEQSTVFIGQSTAISYQEWRILAYFFPKSYPANLDDGFILKVDTRDEHEYYDVKLDDQNQLQATRINWLLDVDVVAVDEEYAYTLSWEITDDGSQLKREYIELSKRSLGTGELSSYPTTNSKSFPNLQFTLGCRVGNRFFGYTNYLTDKVRIVSLNLDTLEWTKTDIELNGDVHQMSTDGDHTLVICMRDYDMNDYCYRFVVNKPESLSTYIWHTVQIAANSRPDVYDFICSKLPTNIIPPRPIENFVPLDS